MTHNYVPRYTKYPVYFKVWHKYPHEICLEVLEKECDNCDSGHIRGFCTHQGECTREYMIDTGWLMPLVLKFPASISEVKL